MVAGRGSSEHIVSARIFAVQREERRVRDPIDHIETEAELKQIQVERETDKAAYEEAQRRIEQLKKDAPIADPIYDGPKDKQNEYRDDPR